VRRVHRPETAQWVNYLCYEYDSDSRFFSTLDCLSLGEVMLRLDPASAASTRRGSSRCGGRGEYNVARGLALFWPAHSHCHGTAENRWPPCGRLHLQAGGHSSEMVPTTASAALCAMAQLYRADLGARAAGAATGHTAISLVKSGDFDWERFSAKNGSRWLHTGGIFAALSARQPSGVEAMDAARKYGRRFPMT